MLRRVRNCDIGFVGASWSERRWLTRPLNTISGISLAGPTAVLKETWTSAPIPVSLDTTLGNGCHFPSQAMGCGHPKKVIGEHGEKICEQLSSQSL